MFSINEIVNAHLHINQDGSYSVNKDSLIQALELYTLNKPKESDPDYFSQETKDLFEQFTRIFDAPAGANLHNTILSETNLRKRMYFGLWLKNTPIELYEDSIESFIRDIHYWLRVVSINYYKHAERVFVSEINTLRLIYKQYLEMADRAKNKSLKLKYLNGAEGLRYAYNLLLRFSHANFNYERFDVNYEPGQLIYFLSTNLTIRPAIFKYRLHNSFHIQFFASDKPRSATIYFHEIVNPRDHAFIFEEFIEMHKLGFIDEYQRIKKYLKLYDEYKDKISTHAIYGRHIVSRPQ